MIIYPDIEIQNGLCVNLLRGQMDQPVVYDKDPVTAALDFVADGAQFLHLVDLDAVANKDDNSEIIAEIILKAGVRVQVAGAIRTMDTVRYWVEAGAARVVIATAAVYDPGFVREAAFAYPDQVVVSVDASEGKVMVEGWKEVTAFSPVEFALNFADVPLAAIIFTDIDRNNDALDSSMAQTELLASSVRSPVIASGVVKTLDDISTLTYLPNIAGAIVGRALFNKVFSLPEALEIAAHSGDPTPDFL